MIGALRLQDLSAGLRETWFHLNAPFRQLPDLSLALEKPPVWQHIARQQFRTMVADLRRSVIACWCGIALVASCLWTINPGIGSAVWTALSVANISVLAALLTRFIKSNPADGMLRRWEVYIGRASVLHGIQWGTSIFLVGEMLISVVAPMAAGILLVIVSKLSLHSRYKPGIYWVALPCAVLVTIALISLGGIFGVAVGVGYLVAVVLLVRLALSQNDLMSETLHHAQERQGLLQELGLQRQQAHDANQAKTRFLAAASHDLRQPIYSIALLTHALAQEARADAQMRRQISASVQAMDDILNSLLEVSKLDIASEKVNLAPASLGMLLDRLQHQFRAQAQDKDIELVVPIQSLYLNTDIDLLYRLLANLVSNAVRFTHRGRVLIRSKVRGPWVWIQVWDSGIGIARQDRQRIFEEFVKISNNDVAPISSTGVGLGLSIVQRLAQRLGCPIVIRSRPGVGSMFAVRVPLERGASAQSVDTDGGLEELLSGLLVLLIEDDPTARRSMQTLLHYCGCHVLAAQSTKDALTMVDQTLRTPDLVVSDYRLGDEDCGLDAIAKVRTAVGASTSALLITADRDVPHAAAFRMGVPVLSKPVKATDLIDALKRLR